MAEECGGATALRPLLVITLHSTFTGQVTPLIIKPETASQHAVVSSRRSRGEGHAAPNANVLHAIPRSTLTANILSSCTSSLVRQ